MYIWLAILIILVAFYLMSEIVDKHFIKSLDNIAEWLKLPHDIAGATLLALGTSAPEISTALIALFIAEEANPAIGVGTIVGSAIFQILVVIGFAAVVRSAQLSWKPVMRDSIFYAISVGLLLIFVSDQKFELWETIVLVSFYFVYLFALFLWTRFVKADAPDVTETKDEKEEEQEEEETEQKNALSTLMSILMWPIDKLLDLLPDAEKKPAWTVPIFVLSLAVIGFASYWLVESAVVVAEFVGVSKAFIALTILAGGTSIPEMISSAIVSRQGRGDMAIANAIGSNIFDIVMSLGLPLLLYVVIKGHAVDVPDESFVSLNSSVTFLFISLIIVVALLIILKFRVTKLLGLSLIGFYVAYITYAYITDPVKKKIKEEKKQEKKESFKYNLDKNRKGVYKLDLKS